jgi:hypothetical protein
MKKFLTKSLTFSCILILLTAGWMASIVFVELAAYRKEIKVPDGADILVCGDSQPAHALNPELWPELFNFSKDATLLDQSRLKTIDILAANPGRINTLILDVTPLKYYGNNPSKPLSQEPASVEQMLIYLTHPHESTRPLGNLVQGFRDTILVKKTGKLHRFIKSKRPYISNLKGGYRPYEKSGLRNAPTLFEKNICRLSNEINTAPETSTETGAFEEWLKTISAARRAGVKRVVLITTPFHPRQISAIKQERIERFLSAVKAFAAENNCDYFNFLDTAIPDFGWRDGNHLNVNGAHIFTEACRKAVTR